MNDTNVLIEDGAVQLKIGAGTIAVKALNIESSVQWTKRVRSAWYAQACKNLTLGKVLADTKTPDEDRLTALDNAMASGAACDLLMVRDLLGEHSPTILTAEALAQATAQQIVAAFEMIFQLENPMKRLRNLMLEA